MADFEKLMQATKEGNLREVENLLAIIDWNSTNVRVRGTNLFHSKAETHKFELLSKAIENKNLQMIELFVKSGFKLNFKKIDNEGASLLIKATETEDRGVVEFLLNHGAQVNGSNNDSALHQASRDGRVNIALLLLDRGALVNKLDYHRKVPLHWAAERGHLEMVKLLTERRALTDQWDSDRSLPVDQAAKRGHRDVFLYLLNRTFACRENIMSVLYHAALGGQLRIVEIIIGNGVNVNMPCTRFSETALHIAAIYDHLELIKLLIERRADVNAKDWAGCTPLYNAKSMGTNPECVELLVQHGAKDKIRKQLKLLQ